MTSKRDRIFAEVQENARLAKQFAALPMTPEETVVSYKVSSRFAPAPQKTQKDIQDFHAKFANIKFGL